MLNYQQDQRSIEWYRDRLGYITGSKVGVLMKSGRTKDKMFSDTAKTYMYQLAAERALNPSIVNDDDMLWYYLDQTSNQSKAMRFGVEQEVNARDLYIEQTQRHVHEVGLCRHATISSLASSPDGITYDNDVLGCIEIKCPTISTYTQYATEIFDNESLKKTNPDYFYQCQTHMACTDAQFCDFTSYCPFIEPPIHIVRIYRDDDEIRHIEQKVMLAEPVITEIYAKLINGYSHTNGNAIGHA